MAGQAARRRPVTSPPCPERTQRARRVIHHARPRFSGEEFRRSRPIYMVNTPDGSVLIADFTSATSRTGITRADRPHSVRYRLSAGKQRDTDTLDKKQTINSQILDHPASGTDRPPFGSLANAPMRRLTSRCENGWNRVWSSGAACWRCIRPADLMPRTPLNCSHTRTRSSAPGSSGCRVIAGSAAGFEAVRRLARHEATRKCARKSPVPLSGCRGIRRCL